MTIAGGIKGLGSYITTGSREAISETGGLVINLKRLKPAPLGRLFGATGYTDLMVDVELKNTSPRAIRIPRGEAAVMADGVGYAYQDRRKVMAAGSIAPGKTKVVRYLFRVPEGSGIGRLILRDEAGERLAGTGFVDLKVPPPPGS